MSLIVFDWRFILNESIFFWLSIIYQKPFVLSTSVFCSQIFTSKLNLRPKIGLTYGISLVKWFFLEFLSMKIFFLFVCWIWISDVSQQYCENLRTSDQAELVENMPPSYLSYRFLHNLHPLLLWEKVKIFVLKHSVLNKAFCAYMYVVTTNVFALNLDKSLQIYFFCVKRQAKKNDFLKDAESTVSFGIPYLLTILVLKFDIVHSTISWCV